MRSIYWGRDFFRLSPSVFCLRQKPPPSSEGGITGARGFSPKTGTLVSAFADISPVRGITRPYAHLSFLFFNRNGQDRSLQFLILYSSFFHFSLPHRGARPYASATQKREKPQHLVPEKRTKTIKNAKFYKTKKFVWFHEKF